MFTPLRLKYQANIQQLKQLGTDGFTRNFTYNTGVNTLQRVDTATPSLIEAFTYDVCGNQLTAGTTRNYVWNGANQLITYYNQAGSADPTIFAQYDYAGQNRVSKMVRTGTSSSPIYERIIYIDGIFEYHILENGTTYEKNYVHVMDAKSRIAMVRVGTPFPDDITDAITYNLEDQIGSSSVRLNTSGTVIDKEEYYPFGDSSLRTFTKKRYRYVGKEKDLESGLYYYGARYYAAWTCRFISIDPLAHDYMHLTPYNYAGNKPINDYDIDGMQSTGEAKTNMITEIPAAKADAVSITKYPVIQLSSKVHNTPPPGEKSANGDDLAWNKYTIRNKYTDNIKVLAPDGNYYTFSKDKLSFTYSDGTEINNQLKKEGVWSVKNSEGYWMWNNVKGKFVKNTSGIGPSKNSMPIFGWLGTTYAGGALNPKGYSQPPQNLADAAAMNHDLNYDALKIAGKEGVWDPISDLANLQLIDESKLVIEMYKRGEIDPYTGAPITSLTAYTAAVMIFSFQTIESIKNKTEKVKASGNSFLNQGARAFSGGYY